MAKKKLLNEAQVRRFMGLAGMEPSLVSNAIKEMQMYEDEPVADEELPPEEEPEMDMAPEEPVADLEPAEEPAEEPAADSEVEVTQDAIDAAEQGLADIQNLLSTLGGGAMEEPAADLEPEPAMDLEPAEEPVAPEEEPMDDEVLEEVELELTEDEIVQEVARRVAKRILKAKKAKDQLDEALGKKK